jgi:hypothetical protein
MPYKAKGEAIAKGSAITEAIGDALLEIASGSKGGSAPVATY